MSKNKYTIERVKMIAEDIRFIYNQIKTIKDMVGIHDPEAIHYLLENQLDYINFVGNKAETLKNKLEMMEN